MNHFSYQIISDGPHRPEQIFLVAGGDLAVRGQVSFGEPVCPPEKELEAVSPEEEAPPLKFVFLKPPQPAEK
jgi:hypothetical protein